MFEEQTIFQGIWSSFYKGSNIMRRTRFADTEVFDRGDDIANLFGNFAVNAKGYLEIDNFIDYPDFPERSPTKPVVPVTSQICVTDVMDATPVIATKAASASLPGAAASTLHSMAERVEPVMGDFPMVSDTASAALSTAVVVPVVLSSLRLLLGEAALKRQAETRARNEKASLQSLLNG